MLKIRVVMIKNNKYKFLLLAIFISYSGIANAACVNQDYSCTCNAGYYAVNQGTSTCYCSQCPAGTYKSTASTATSCTNCPAVTDFTTTLGITVLATSSLGSTSESSCYVVSGSYRDLSMNTFSLLSSCVY
ncbi:MAG: hypothetical protein JXR28_00440 [Alphaproteobacteria bacterium]|nr:hypothetical protein [Alphaproteobacteria bacterium]